METLHGIIHGRTIYLDSDPGLEPGQPVDLVLSTGSLSKDGHADRIRALAGSLGDMPEDEEILKRIEADRKSEFRPYMYDGDL